MNDTIKVTYQFNAQARMYGQIGIPRDMFERKDDDELWSPEIEKYITENHDYLLQPAEVDDDCEMYDVTLVTESA